jgi:hypothetical protein
MDGRKQMTKTAVIGDGWAALAAVARVCARGEQVTWITTNSPRLAPPLSYLGSEAAAQSLLETCQSWGIEPGTIEQGDFQREFRNKAFHPSGEMSGFRFSGMDLPEIEAALVAALATAPGLERLENIPLMDIKPGEPVVVTFASGEKKTFDQVISAERWSTLREFKSLPKPILSLVRKTAAQGMLQVSFSHSEPIGPGARETFVCGMYKESGESFERKVTGYFSANGRQSTWSVDVSASEGEDNHEISKRLRKIKQTLNRVFIAEWLPAGVKDFLTTISDETVRFEESVTFIDQEQEIKLVDSGEGLVVLTDGLGFSAAWQSIAGDTLGSRHASPMHRAPAESAQQQTESTLS